MGSTTRILAITNWYPPHHYGGYELSCFDVMTRLEARGHEVAVLCSDQRLPTADPPTAHERVVDRSLRLYHTGEDLLVPPLRERLAIERHNQARLAAALDAVRPEVVSAWHFAALSLGLLTTLAGRRIPVVYSVCDEWPVFGVRLDQWARIFDQGRLRRRAGRLVTRVTGVPATLDDPGTAGPALFVTDDLRRRTMARSRLRFADEAVVYSGIDSDVYPPRPPTTEAWGWRLVVAGRFDPRKGFETVIRALALLPDATLALWGRGGEAERRRLRAVAEEVGVADRVTMGALERHEMAAAYAAADAVVFPSEWDEPFGLVPVEAMACGTPVVATGVGGSREFLANGRNCVLFRPGDPADLARALHDLAEAPERRRAITAAGRRTAQALDVERLADVMEDWHLHAAGARARPPERVLSD